MRCRSGRAGSGASSASVRFSSIARAMILSTSHGDRLVERVVALEAGELDDLLHQPGEPLALGVHPAGEALHRLGVVGGVDDGVGEQLDRADRRLQLVAHVGHEVAPDRLDPALAGAVLDQGEHQLGAQRRHPGGDVARRQPRALHEQLGLADLPVAAYLPDQVGELAHGDLVAAHEPHRDGRAPRPSARRRSASTTSALLRRTESTAATPGGRAGSGSLRRAAAGARSTRKARTAPPPSTAPSSAKRRAWMVGLTPSIVRRVSPSVRLRRLGPSGDCSPAGSRNDANTSPAPP